MENSYPNDIPTVHPFRDLTESQLSKLSFKAGDSVVDTATNMAIQLTADEADQVRLRVADEVEKELRKIRRNQ